MTWPSGLSQNQQLACPRCQEKFPISETVFLCPEPHCRACKNPLPGQPPQWSGKPLFRPPRYAYSVPCPFSPHTAYVKICPRCWSPLPISSGKSSTVAIIGASASGKTCFMTALIRQIRRQLARRSSLEMSLEWDDDAGRQYFREQERTIFHECTLPEQTQRESPLASLQFTIRFPISGWLSRLRYGSQGVVSVVCPDPSGEFFEKLEDAYYLNYLSQARAVLLMVDPMTSEVYRRRRKAQGKDIPYEGTSSADALRSFVTALRRATNQEQGTINKELAVVMAKCDEEGMFDPDQPKYAADLPRQGRLYNPQIAEDISELVLQHMEDLELEEVAALARQSFKSVCFFAASALGSPPVINEVNGQLRCYLRDPQPRRVEEPLLWILHQWGYI